MPTDDARRVVRAAALIEAIRTHQTQVYELTEQLAAVLKGDPAIGDQLKEYYATWDEHHKAVYGTPYAFNFKVDASHAKRFIKLFGLRELSERMLAYHRDRDDFLVRAKHPHGLFVSGINRYGKITPMPMTLEAPILNCRHIPRCQNDQEHTKRMVVDLEVVR